VEVPRSHVLANPAPSRHHSGLYTTVVIIVLFWAAVLVSARGVLATGKLVEIGRGGGGVRAAIGCFAPLRRSASARRCSPVAARGLPSGSGHSDAAIGVVVAAWLRQHHETRGASEVLVGALGVVKIGPGQGQCLWHCNLSYAARASQ
jgi:hypothetical protein